MNVEQEQYTAQNYWAHYVY